MNPVIKISAYQAWKNRPGCKPYDTDFYTEMDRIKTGYYKPIVDKYRSISDPEKKAEYKVSELPSLTISAVCTEWRKLENVVNHTGLLNIDIDGKSNPHIADWAAVRDQIFTLKGVVSSFLSVSGNGVTFVVKIKPEQHKDTFFSIVDGLKHHFNIQADVALHDVTRLRFVSDDHGCRIRYDFDSIPVCEPSPEYLISKRYNGTVETTLEPVGEADSEYNFDEAVKRATTAHKEFVLGAKWTFLVSVAGTCNTMGMSLDFCKAMVMKRYRPLTDISDEKLLQPVEEVYRQYKSQHASFNIQASFERLNKKLRDHLVHEWIHAGLTPNDDEVIEIAKQFEANPERVRFVIERVFGEFSEEFGYNDFPSVQKVQIWLSKRWRFRFNKVTGQAEMSGLNNPDVQNVNADEIFRQLQVNRFKYNLNNVKSLLRSDFMESYDPIHDYFRALTFDSSKDFIAELASYIQTADQDFWIKQFKKALVRSIACGLGKKENRLVMVLFGKKQETGKSTFIRFLSPWEDSKYYTESPIIGGNQKDTEIRFSENFIYNMEELAGLSRVDVNKLKADISKSFIKERRAYAAYETSAPRRCNFWASTNQKEFLHDEENTRWLIFEVLKINWAYKTEINIHKVWAQAWQLYQNGFDYNLDAEDRIIREETNDTYRYRRPEEELFVRHFQPADRLTGKFYSATDIASLLNNAAPSMKINPNNIGKTVAAAYEMESCQVKINGKNTRGYWLKNTYTEGPDGELPRPKGYEAITDEEPF